MSRKFRNQKLVKKAALIIVALASTALMVMVVFIYKSNMVTTRIGEGCMIAAGCILFYTNARSIGRFYRFKDYNNKEFIGFLKQTRLNQIRFHQKTQVIGLVLCTISLPLYLFELVYKHTLVAIVIYTLTIIYFLVLWLVVRPRTFRKQSEKLNNIINKLEQLSKQL
ncbi:MAG: hypothetical protein ACXVI9_10955 [Mucilaginibacter sp.]